MAKKKVIKITQQERTDAVRQLQSQDRPLTLANIQNTVKEQRRSLLPPSPLPMPSPLLPPRNELGNPDFFQIPGPPIVIDLSPPRQQPIPQQPISQQQTLANFIFKTGDPQYDDFLNNRFLPKFKKFFQNNPLAAFNAANDPAYLKEVIDHIGRSFGLIFEKAKTRAEETFTREKSQIDLQRREQLARLGISPEGFEPELAVERRRITEDVELTKKREARNLQDALRETADAYASAGRAFGEGRVEKERGVEEKSRERISDLQREADRRLEDIKRQEAELSRARSFTEEQLGERGFTLQELQAKRSQELERLEGEKFRLGRQELERLSEELARQSTRSLT